MKTLWFKSTDNDKDKKAIEDAFSSSSLLIERLVEILDNEIVSTSVTLVSDYDKPSWAYMRADKDGYIRGLQYVKKLLDKGTNK